jgi:hypothetical protein
MLLVHNKYTVGITYVGWEIDEPYVTCKHTNGKIGLLLLTREMACPIVTPEYVSFYFVPKIKHPLGREVRIIAEYLGEYANAGNSVPCVLSPEVIALWKGLYAIAQRVERGKLKPRDLYKESNI